MKGKSSRNPVQPPGRARDGNGDSFPLPLGTPTRLSEAGSERPSARPLYLQVKDHLIRRVLSGEWRPGECLPSEMKLAEDYGLSQGTVRKAIEEMSVQGLVTRHPGRGTFVTSHRGDYHPTRFRRFYSDTGKRIAGSESSYISCRRINASPRIAAGLQVKPGADIAEIVRVRYLDERPVLLESIMLNTQLCPEAELVFEQRKPSSIYLTLEQTYNILIMRVDERLRPRAATQEEAELIELAPASPVLEVERLAYSLGGECVEYRISVCGSDEIYYRNQAD
jgi:GntR family transcriptional regulator